MLNSKFWNKYFRVYDVLNFVIPYQELLQEIITELKVKPEELILDAGVGTGNLAILMERAGAKVIGLDFSQEALDIYKNKNPQARIILHDLTRKLPFQNNYFDKIVSNNVLYNFPKEKRLEIMMELKRVLRPDGKVILSNLHRGFRPIKIYLTTIKENLKRFGFLKTLKLVIKMFIPAVEMFYYNFFIQKEYKFSKNNLFDLNEQKELLKQAGFNNISKTKMVYAEQGILNSAIKV
ncbi:MAG: methyltransferase domain-containing protein [Candidatus Paceibacterota bacterium]